MLANERQRIICEKLQREGQVLVSELAVELKVSDETIRRDINTLDEAKLVRRVHGGAIPVKDNLPEPSYIKRAETNRDAKRKIGAYAARLIQDDDIVAFGTGVTTDEMVYSIYGVHNVTLLITSVAALNILVKKKLDGDFTGQILFLGGIVDAENNCVVGTMTNQILEGLSADKAFIGATTVSQEGAHAYNLDDGLFSSLLVKHSAEVYILAESAKFGKKTLYKQCDLDGIHHVITDQEYPLTLSMKKALAQSGIHIHLVE